MLWSYTKSILKGICSMWKVCPPSASSQRWFVTKVVDRYWRCGRVFYPVWWLIWRETSILSIQPLMPKWRFSVWCHEESILFGFKKLFWILGTGVILMNWTRIIGQELQFGQYRTPNMPGLHQNAYTSFILLNYKYHPSEYSSHRRRMNLFHLVRKNYRQFQL